MTTLVRENDRSQFGQEYENPPEMWLVKSYVMVAIVGLGMLAVAYPATNVRLLLYAGGLGPAVPILAVWYREYYHRPVSVRIEEDGFSMRFRYKSDKLVHWGEISDICRERGDPSTPRGRKMRSGALHLKGDSIPYPLTYEIASSLWNAYVEQVGTAPPIWSGE